MGSGHLHSPPTWDRDLWQEPFQLPGNGGDGVKAVARSHSLFLRRVRFCLLEQFGSHGAHDFYTWFKGSSQSPFCAELFLAHMYFEMIMQLHFL